MPGSPSIPAEWKQSAVMPALTIVQDANGGWLTPS
jgi:NADH-quinone oxidoreductase subunit E